APPEAVRFHTELYGLDGVATVPSYDETHERALRTAIDQLLATAAAGRADHPCDVRFARDVVAVLAAAERDAASRTGFAPEELTASVAAVPGSASQAPVGVRP